MAYLRNYVGKTVMQRAMQAYTMYHQGVRLLLLHLLDVCLGTSASFAIMVLDSVNRSVRLVCRGPHVCDAV